VETGRGRHGHVRISCGSAAVRDDGHAVPGDPVLVGRPRSARVESPLRAADRRGVPCARDSGAHGAASDALASERSAAASPCADGASARAASTSRAPCARSTTRAGAGEHRETSRAPRSGRKRHASAGCDERNSGIVGSEGSFRRRPCRRRQHRHTDVVAGERLGGSARGARRYARDARRSLWDFGARRRAVLCISRCVAHHPFRIGRRLLLVLGE
jgi:hypothetical protein